MDEHLREECPQPDGGACRRCAEGVSKVCPPRRRSQFAVTNFQMSVSKVCPPCSLGFAQVETLASRWFPGRPAIPDKCERVACVKVSWLLDLASLAACRLDVIRMSIARGDPYVTAKEDIGRARFEDPETPLYARQAIANRIVHQVPIAKIPASPQNPRQRLGRIDEVAAGVVDHQRWQPVVVRRARRGYELIAGHPRLEAVKALGWTEIPAVLRDEMNAQAYVQALVESLQRED